MNQKNHSTLPPRHQHAQVLYQFEKPLSAKQSKRPKKFLRGNHQTYKMMPVLT
uniref:Uncharacterized protein n=1 Tax=Arundo donax TaxID=35708 RepID=A0A0A8ZCP1_ARUDO